MTQAATYNLVMIGNGQKKGTCLNQLALHLDLTSTSQMLIFFYNRISRKFDYWSTMKLSLVGRAVICNHVILFILLFFIIVWQPNSNKIWRKIQGAIRNYLWFGKEQLMCTRVRWKECCIKKYIRLELGDLDIGKIGLLCKWIFKATEMGDPNLMLYYRLARYNPQ